MSGRVLIVEPDTSGRLIMDRVLAADGHTVDVVGSATAAREQLARGTPVDLALVDEFGEHGRALEDVRTFRRDYPSLPIIVIGTLLSTHILEELLRLGAVDSLRKPFTPNELRDAVNHALARRSKRHDDALEFAAAVDLARRSLSSHSLMDAAIALRRAQAISPLDAEVMGLQALLAEVEGRDADAERAFRAALALRDNEDTPPPDPHEGLARLTAYAGAHPVTSLRPELAESPLWLVTDSTTELSQPSPAGEGPQIVVMSLGLGHEGGVYFRDATAGRGYALLTGSSRTDSLAHALRAVGSGRLVALDTTKAAVDLERLESQRRSSPPPKTKPSC